MVAYIRDGFAGQRMRVLAPPVVAAARADPITARLMVTDVGYFPKAANHGRARRSGAGQAVVIICAEGKGFLEYEDSTMPVRAGQAIVLPPYRPHAYHADRADPWTLWWLHATGDDLDDLLEPLGGRRIVDLHDSAFAVRTVETALLAVERDESRPSLLAAAGAAWHLLAALAADAAAGPRDVGGPVERAQAYLAEHFDQHLTVAEVAAAVGLSGSHLAALFRKATGGGVLHYLTGFRMARARVLLVTTDWPVAVIARLVGYVDPLYFSRQFRAANGVSPRGFRQGS